MAVWRPTRNTREGQCNRDDRALEPGKGVAQRPICRQERGRVSERAGVAAGAARRQYIPGVQQCRLRLYRELRFVDFGHDFGHGLLA